MKLRLDRVKYFDEGVFGILLIDGHFECCTLEDKEREGEEKVLGKTAIPKGTYKVRLTYSNRFKTVLPLLLNVPNFEGVRIHVGNWVKDTEGCILVGKSFNLGERMLLNSRKALTDLLLKMYNVPKEEEIELTIT